MHLFAQVSRKALIGMVELERLRLLRQQRLLLDEIAGERAKLECGDFFGAHGLNNLWHFCRQLKDEAATAAGGGLNPGPPAATLGNAPDNS